VGRQSFETSHPGPVTLSPASVAFLRWAARAPAEGGSALVAGPDPLPVGIFVASQTGPIVRVDPLTEAEGDLVITHPRLVTFRQDPREALPQLLERGFAFRVAYVESDAGAAALALRMMLPNAILVLGRAPKPTAFIPWARCGDGMAFVQKRNPVGP
jgi:hypothetical protein